MTSSLLPAHVDFPSPLAEEGGRRPGEWLANTLIVIVLISFPQAPFFCDNAASAQPGWRNW